MSNCLSINNLTVKYQETAVLEELSLVLPDYLLAAIVGPNGAGKSTLLKALLDLVPKEHGEVLFWNTTFNKSRKKIAYIPQRSSIDWDFPATVFDVVIMGLFVHKGLFERINKKDKQLALNALERVGLSDFKHRQISQLSGGQQQRVFIARALVQNPDLYLLDEPFAGVDASSELSIINILKELVKEKKSVIVVHHNLETVKEYFDYLILINKKLVAHGPVKETFTAQNISKTYGAWLPQFEEIG
jgi:manganese/zinc/iron transport system ATP- binding protein